MEETSSAASKTEVASSDTDRISVTDLGPIGSISFKETEVPDTYELLDRLNCEELSNLRIHFYEKKVDEKIKEPKGSTHPRFGGSKLKKDEFIYAIENVVGTNEYETAASDLFDRIVQSNAEEHKGFVWWEQILDELIEYLSEKTKARPSEIIKESFSQLYLMHHCKRETIVRVVPVQTPTSFSYVIVSNYGKLGIYDWSMKLLEHYEVNLGAQIATTAGGEVRRTTWVTDAVYMADAAMLLVAVSDRSLHFYSSSGLVCVPIYHISGLPNTPTCLHYTASVSSDDPSMLLVGDDHGSITTMHFHQPHYALFKRTSSDTIDTYFLKELGSQKAWVTFRTDHEIHKDEITRVKYFRDNNTVVSCSNDPNTTVIIRYIIGRRAPYVFKVSRGVRCFHLDRSLKLLATGGKDSVIRLWNPIIPRKPLASLFGHKTCIVDVRIVRYLSAVLSMSKDAVVKTWDITSQACMQSLPLLFPVYGALARTPEFGVQAFYPGPVSCEQPLVIPEHPPTDSTLSKHFSNTESSNFLSETDGDFNAGETQDIKSKSNNTVSESQVSSGITKTGTSFNSASAPTDKDVSSCASCTGSPWTRMELLAVCCNYVAILQLSERELQESDSTRVGEPRDPPLRNQDPIVPSPWLTVDTALMTGFTDNILQQPLRGEPTSSVPPIVIETLQKSLGEEMTQQFTALAATCNNLTAVQDTHKTDLKKIRTMVEQCAPHLALDTSKLEDISFSHTGIVSWRKDQPKGKDTPSKVARASLMTPDESNMSSSRVEDPSSKTTSTTNKSTNK